VGTLIDNKQMDRQDMEIGCTGTAGSLTELILLARSMHRSEMSLGCTRDFDLLFITHFTNLLTFRLTFICLC
jgi:hypothetical protein